jgi:hypothetical protein
MQMTMEDDSGVSFPAGGYGDFEKELLWDGAAFDFSNFNGTPVERLFNFIELACTVSYIHGD